MCRRIKRTLWFHQDQILRNCVASLFSSKKCSSSHRTPPFRIVPKLYAPFPGRVKRRTKIIAGENNLTHKADDSHSRAAVVGHCEPLA